MTTTKRDNDVLLLLTLLSGGGGGDGFLLRDDFTTATAAPLGSPLAGEPGPGEWVLVDTGNKVSKAGGLRVMNGMTSGGSVNTDPRQYKSFARVGGRAFLLQANCSVDRMTVGWFNQANGDISDISIAFQTIASGFFMLNTTAGGSVNVSAFANSTNYQFTFIVFPTGGVVLVKGGTYTNWSLPWLLTEGTAATIYAMLSGFGVTAAYTNDTARVRDLGATFQSAANLSTFTDTTLALGDNWTGAADAVNEFEFTLPGSPLSLDEAAILRFHWTDDNNCWKAYIRRNVGNTAWDMLVDSVSLGVPTNRLTVTGVAAPSLLRVRHVGSLIDCFTRESGIWMKRGAQVNVSFQNTVTGVEISGTAGTTLTRVADYAYTRADYATSFDPHFL